MKFGYFLLLTANRIVAGLACIKIKMVYVFRLAQ